MSTTRILRTRSGRELRRIESPKKVKKVADKNEAVKNEADKNEAGKNEIENKDHKDCKKQTNDDEWNDEKKEKKSLEVFKDTCKVIPVKRKRGRPRKSVGNKLSADVIVKAEEACASPPKKKEKTIVEENSGIEQSRRKPRMASLNAMAKVNAVLDCYRTDSKKEIREQIKEIDKKCLENQEKLLATQKHLEPTFPNIEQQDENVFTEQITNKCEKSTETESPENTEYSETIGLQNIANSKIEMIDEYVQTEKYHRCTQTEVQRFPYEKTERLCTCPKACHDLFPYYAPNMSYNYLTNPIHIKSTAIAHANGHTLAIPIVKKHLVWDKETSLFASGYFTDNVSCLVDSCLTNTLVKNKFPCSKLMYLSSFKDDVTPSQEEKLEIKSKKKVQKKISKKSKGLLVPSLNYADISVPNSQVNVDTKKVSEKAADKPKQVKKLKIKNEIVPQRKSCNGWEFESTLKEENIKQNGTWVTRKYYHGLKRVNEEIKIHDAVILKSGSEDTDYVARITAIYEDNAGVYAGDMMISVFWYYKPEQTNGKTNETKGEKMEVFASRHRDDNSVACIIDRCFVISFPQFCRFRAQQLISKEKREQKTTAVVPENKNNRSRFIPSPDTHPYLVYFCRYGYDSRGGKMLKTF